MVNKKLFQGVAVFCKRCEKPFLGWGLPPDETVEEHLQSKEATEWIKKGYIVELFSPSTILSESDWCYGSTDSCEPYKSGDKQETLIKHEVLITHNQVEKIRTLSEKLKLSGDQVMQMIIDAYELR